MIADLPQCPQPGQIIQIPAEASTLAADALAYVLEPLQPLPRQRPLEPLQVRLLPRQRPLEPLEPLARPVGRRRAVGRGSRC